MDAQTLFGTQFLALAFFQNFQRFDARLAWSGVAFLELCFYALHELQKREDYSRRLTD